VVTAKQVKDQFYVRPLTFTVKHESWDGNMQDHADQGVCILVSTKIEGKNTILIRFNCFDFEKSYVYGPENGRFDSSQLYRMDPIVDGNPINWTIGVLRTMLPDMLVRAGYSSIAAQVDLDMVSEILPELSTTARYLAITARNTVKHGRGPDIFEAGNIRFGLEMRRQQDGNGGLAIHVLTDLSGTPGKSYTEEVEILAFDCFKDGPHYHYGPRNKNHQIYWDTTLIHDPLDWVLRQFSTRMLGPMIERAGYPGVASDLDQDVLDDVLPRMSERAKEMELMGLPLEPTPSGIVV
jgi:hypothetical protein